MKNSQLLISLFCGLSCAKKERKIKNVLVFFLTVLLFGIMSCSAQVQTKSMAPQVQPYPAALTVQTSQQTAPTTQNKPKVAVYVTGGKNANENQALTARITHALVNSGQYSTIERADAFLNQIAREMTTQRSGAIDDRQISKLGQQAGANFVCVGEILEVFGDHQISARIINVESVEVAASGVAEGPLKNISDFAALSNSVVASMLGVAQIAVTPDSSTVAFASQAVSSTPETTAVQATPQAPPVSQSVTPVSGVTTFVDPRDQKIYTIKSIGDYTWFLQDIVYGSDNGKYNWDQACRVCPDGWRLPGSKELGALQNYLSSALPNDVREFNKDFAASSSGSRPKIMVSIGRANWKYWWSATEYNSRNAYRWAVSGGSLNSYDNGKSGTGAVRCVKDD
jgi:uncharacterized protein (TIGR02145 family)